MGMYASVRGWIELDHKQRQRAEQIIEQAQDDHYSGAGVSRTASGDQPR
jgi:hypothetical protein